MRRIGLVVALLTGVLLSTAGPGAAQGAWTDERVPGRDGFSVLDTVTSGHGVSWAFGGWYQGQPNWHSQAYQRGAQGWQEVPVPDIGRIHDSGMGSATDVWALGSAASLHWDGARWTEIPMAAPPRRHRAQLSAISSYGADVLAAGTFVSDDPNVPSRGTVQRWDGGTWVEDDLPNLGREWSLSGIGGVSPNDLWAVGSVSGQPGQGVAMHFDGQRWSEVPVPKLDGAQEVNLVDVAARSSDDVWAVGTQGLPGQDRPVAMHWDGQRWSVQETPDGPGGVRGAVLIHDRPWAIGSTIGGDPYLLRHDGTAWQRVNGPGGGPHGASPMDDGNLLVVGSTGPSQQRQPFASIYRE